MLQPERPAAGLDLDAPTVVVCAYGLLIPEPLLAERSWLNVHPSLLPRWRGAAPVERAILAGDPTTGVTIHETVPELDAGPVAAREAFPIGPDDDAGAVFANAAVVAAKLLDQVLASQASDSSHRSRTVSRMPTRSHRPIVCSISRGPPQSSCGRCARCRRTSEPEPICTAAR